MQDNRGSYAFPTDLPAPTEQQGRCGNQHIWNSFVHERVRCSEQDGSHQIGNTQVTQTSGKSLRNAGVNTHSEDHLLGNGRHYKKNGQPGCGAAHICRRIVAPEHYQGANWSAEEGQKIGGESERGRSEWDGAHRWIITVAIASFTLFSADSALAALGAVHAATQVDSGRMIARRHTNVMPGHSVHKAVMQDGSQVQEFVSSDGQIFAVSWRTHYKPNLAHLLGTSYPVYTEVARQSSARPGIQRHFRYIGSDLVVKSNSHLNVFSGIAYRRSLLPPGVTAEQIE